jgi:ABC-type Fe3+/spermidine/putrescine transport system ATPase subunit
MNGLELLNLSKLFNGRPAVDGISFNVQPAEIVAVLGPSGSGKSTLLGLVAGLDAPDRGDILWDGVSLANIPPHERGFGLMFQDFALFPHRNVFENVAFGLKMAHLDQRQIETKVKETLALVGLPGFERRDVNTLSGGEQQRIALARSLAPGPRLLMLDEPLGSLDRNLRERLVIDLRHVLHHSRQTAIYVTHDQEEAFALADRVAVMRLGRIEQVGTPQEIYKTPANVFVARFLGLNNIFPGEIVYQAGIKVLNSRLGVFAIRDDLAPGPVNVLLRPEAVTLDGQDGCRVTARVKDRTFRGNGWQITVSSGEFAFFFEITGLQDLPAIDESVCLSFDPATALQIIPDSPPG